MALQLINGFGKRGEIQRMEQILDEMVCAGLTPDVVTFGALIDCYGKAGDLEKMEAAASQLQSAGLRPDLMVFTSMMDAYGKAGLLQEMMMVVKRMERAQCWPNAHTCSTLISSLASMGLYDRAEKAYRDWLKKGAGVADVALYNTLADLYAKSENVDKMERILRQMRDNGCRPNLITWNTVIDGYGRVGNLVKMESCLETLEKEGLQPDCTTFTAMIHAYGRRNMFGEMKKCWNGMLESDCKTCIPGYSAVIDTYGKAGRVSEAEAVVEKMSALGVPPSVVTWTSLIDAYCRAGQYDKVGPAFEQMLRDGCRGNLLTATSLIAGLCGCEDLGEAQPLMQCLSRCQEEGMYVPLMHLLILKGVVSEKAGEIDKMWMAVDHLLARLGKSEPVEWLQALFSTLTEGLWTFGWAGRSQRVVKFALRRGIYPQLGCSNGEWTVDLHSMSVGAAVPTLFLWLNEVREWALASRRAHPELEADEKSRHGIEQFIIITGWGRHSWKEGESRIRTAVEAKLEQMGSPFTVVGGNHGRLVAEPEKLRAWVLQRRDELDKWLHLQDAEDAGPPW
ncbi:hypothetical protein CBR_g31210 [Chara braunii]|uniref:Smr domain-containing protein n=1 Tax=Chara braunii TaxID=69332 RepID=A0A388JXX8_CHABU|nr:hypothetical protein CBR_g31210 [Chara braunii]|eukprot:GBG62573.1 hypothetical protein CBR_g31210 [Chara braunii]